MKFIVVVLVLCSGLVFGYSGGDGTAESPYLIVNYIDFDQLAQNTADYSKSFKLINDLELGSGVFSNSLIAPHGVTPFTGTFDGNGFSIKNMTIATSDDVSRGVGLFGETGTGAVIKNLTLENVSIGSVSSDIVDLDTSVGAFVGEGVGTTIQNCKLIGGNICGSFKVAGIAGSLESSTVEYTSSQCNVSGKINISAFVSFFKDSTMSYCHSSGLVRGYMDVAGFISYPYRSDISRCFTDADLEETYDYRGDNIGMPGFDEYPGSFGGFFAYSFGANCWECYSDSTITVEEAQLAAGFVATMSGRIENCYCIGEINRRPGMYEETYPLVNAGFAGSVGEESEIINCYTNSALNFYDYLWGFVKRNRGTVSGCIWNSEKNAYASDDIVPGVTNAQMADVNTFLAAGWSFPENTTEDFPWVQTTTRPELAFLDNLILLDANVSFDVDMPGADVSEVVMPISFKTYNDSGEELETVSCGKLLPAEGSIEFSIFLWDIPFSIEVVSIFGSDTKDVSVVDGRIDVDFNIDYVDADKQKLLKGDMNLDGVVGFGDFVTLADNWLMEL